MRELLNTAWLLISTIDWSKQNQKWHDKALEFREDYFLYCKDKILRDLDIRQEIARLRMELNIIVTLLFLSICALAATIVVNMVWK